MTTNYIIVEDAVSGYLLARAVQDPNGRLRYVPSLQTVQKSLLTAELALNQLTAGAKYAELKDAVWAILHGDPCDLEKCATEGVCAECLGRLEDVFDALEPKT